MNRHIEKYHNIVDQPTHNLVIDQPLVNHTNVQKPTSIVYGENQFDKCLQLPNNFIYAGSSQSVSYYIKQLYLK